MVAWTKSGQGNISFIANGRQYYVTKDHARYEDVLQGLKDGVDESALANMVEKATVIKNYLNEQGLGNGELTVQGGQVLYRDEFGNVETCHGTVVERLLSFMAEGLPVNPLINFIKKLMQNPSYAATQELFDFLEHKNLPICEDGDFLAYKAVRHDYTDKRKGKFDNTPGNFVRERRNLVDDNRKEGCSKGLHAGTLEYVNSFGSFRKDAEGNPTEDSDKCVIVKINPMNVVSVPLDCNCQKLRACEYYSLKDFEGELNYHLATDNGDEWEDDEDEDLEDFEWDEVGDDEEEVEELDFEDLEIGDEIEFFYKKRNGKSGTRYVEVVEKDHDSILGELLDPEPNEGEVRRFIAQRMSDIGRIE